MKPRSGVAKRLRLGKMAAKLAPGSTPNHLARVAEYWSTAVVGIHRPVLVSLIGTPAASLVLETSYVFMGKRVNNTSMLGNAIDACVYFGNSTDVALTLDPDPAIYRATPYGAEIARRRKIMEIGR